MFKNFYENIVNFFTSNNKQINLNTNTYNSKILLLFDIDGTLTEPREKITEDMDILLKKLRKKVKIGVVGGSDFIKQKEQLGDDCLNNFDYNFAENGLIGYQNGELFHTNKLVDKLGEDELQNLINEILRYLYLTKLPKKRGTFIEYRSGMLNVSPIGRNCSKEERNEFEKYDKQYKIRERMISHLKKKFIYLNLNYSIGGQISFDIFPTGWDKTYCLNLLNPNQFKEIHFFGDKTYKGGNDFEIFNDKRVFGHTVTSSKETYDILSNMFNFN